MAAICEIDARGVWTGATREIEETDGAPVGWVWGEAPDVPKGKAARWAGEWEIIDPPPAPDLLPALKADKLAALAQKRWEVETGGVMVQGSRIETDDRAKLLLLGKRTKAKETPDGTTRWKAGQGQFVDLPNAFIVAAADAVEAHVQACFEHEGDLTAAILAATTIEALDAIDINAGWPA